MMYSYEVKGVDINDQTWTVSGNVLAPEIADSRQVCDMVGREVFAQLTQGKAVYGDPGRGCRGPYKLTEFSRICAGVGIGATIQMSTLDKYERSCAAREDGKWFVAGSHWGEYFIERHCTQHDPQWKGSWVNGIPIIQYTDGIWDPHLAYDLAHYLNQVYE